MIFQYVSKALPPLLCVFFLSSCALPYLHKTPCDTIPKPEDFPIAITQWETIAQEHTDVAKSATAHLWLALLYSHYKNLNPDYLMALNELETYVNLDKEHSNADEIQNLLALLRSLKAAGEENKRLASEREHLPQENQEMKIKMEQLIKENQEIKKTVEELKHLDINIEEKRRQIK